MSRLKKLNEKTQNHKQPSLEKINLTIQTANFDWIKLKYLQIQATKSDDIKLK